MELGSRPSSDIFLHEKGTCPGLQKTWVGAGKGIRKKGIYISLPGEISRSGMVIKSLWPISSSDKVVTDVEQDYDCTEKRNCIPLGLQLRGTGV